MDAILDEANFIMIQGELGATYPEEAGEDIKVSTWIRDKDSFRGSTDILLIEKLDPGAYVTEFSRDFGVFCKKIDTKTDELFTFTNSIIEPILQEIRVFWDKKDLYKKHNLIHKRGILLEGYPGTGKTSIISLLSDEIIRKGGVVFKVTSWKNLEVYMDFLKFSFRKIEPETPIITIIEDIDQYENVEPELLDFLDGKSHIEHHVVIATSNDTSNIPDTYLRPSRLDLKVEVPLPNEETRKEYFKYKGVPEEDLDSLAEQTDKLSLADLKELYICKYLLDYTTEDAITKVANPTAKKNYLNKSSNSKDLAL